MNPKTIICIVLAGASLASVSGAAAEATESVEDRLRATVAGALRRSPGLRSSLLELEARRSDLEQLRFAGSPYLEWQREGIGPSFSHRANAQISTRLGGEFNVPFLHTSPGRRLSEAAGAMTAAGSRAAVLRRTEEVTLLWLELASLADRISIAAGRLAHLDRVLTLEQKRLELGEVAGTQVLQLELERAREASRLRALEAAGEASVDALTRLCGGPPSIPMSGDLERLNRFTSTPPDRDEVLARVEEAPELRLATADAGAEKARADLVRTTAWGRPEAEVEWEHFPTMDGVPGYDAVGLRLAIPLPIGRAGSAARREAQTLHELSESAAEERRLGIEQRVLRALATARGAAARLEELDRVRDHLPASEHSLAEQFRLGAISYLAYLDGLARHDGILLEAVDATLVLLSARLDLAVTLDDPRCFPLPSLTDLEVTP